MQIVIVGAGYVGLVSSACFAEAGINVACVDSNAERIRQLQEGHIPIFEPGLEELVERNAGAGRLVFRDNLGDEIAQADAVFIAVGTPTHRDSQAADLSFVNQAARGIAERLDPKQGRTVIVTKSTVPVGTAISIEKLVVAARPELRPGRDFDVASNPEFLREGSAIEDFMRPARVICGTEGAHAERVLRELYAPLSDRGTPMMFTDRATAELIKLASNSFLAMKVSFINEIADLCEQCNADVQDLARGLGLDQRIGPRFLRAGPGFGGSCFPKDADALVAIAREHGVDAQLVETTIRVNDLRKHAMAERIRALMGGSVAGKRIAVLGVTFKPNTDDLREAPSLVIVPELMAMDASVAAYDPAASANARSVPALQGVLWVESAEAAMREADAVVVLTEWDEFRSLSARRMAELLRGPVVIDLRNALDPEDVQSVGLQYYGVGRGRVQPTPAHRPGRDRKPD